VRLLGPQQEYSEVLHLIRQGRDTAERAVNPAFIDTYWKTSRHPEILAPLAREMAQTQRRP
jgi:hypothetical protein